MDFYDRLARSEVGDEIVYHTGLHCLDSSTALYRKLPNPKAAWESHLRGDVILYQRRVGKGQFDYIAKVLK